MMNDYDMTNEWPEWAKNIPDEGVHLPKWQVVQAIEWYMMSRNIKRNHDGENYIDLSVSGKMLGRIGLTKVDTARAAEAHHTYGALWHIFQRLGFLEFLPEDER